MNNLPNDRGFKCTLRCIHVTANLLDEETGTYNVTFILDNIRNVSDYALKILLKMRKGCSKSVAMIRDTCEKVYIHQKCMKKNDIVVCIFLFFQRIINFLKFIIVLTLLLSSITSFIDGLVYLEPTRKLRKQIGICKLSNGDTQIKFIGVILTATLIVIHPFSTVYIIH